MAIDLWRHFKKGLTVYIGIGIAVSFLSAANVFIFKNYSIHLARHLIGQLFLSMG